MSATVVPIRKNERRLVDVNGLIDLFGFSERYWRYRIADGMPAHRWGKRLRFDPAEVEAWMEERYAKQAG